MYLKQLYKQHKGWFLFVVLFIVGQLFINFKRGVVFSPFYHYGMYSEKMELEDSVAIAAISINNEQLEPFDFSAQEWDKLTMPIYQYQDYWQHNKDMYYQDIERLLNKLRIQPTGLNFEIAHPSGFLFHKWYHAYLEGIVGNKTANPSAYVFKTSLKGIKQTAQNAQEAK